MFHIFFPIFIFNSYRFVVVAVVAMWIYLRESLVSLCWGACWFRAEKFSAGWSSACFLPPNRTGGYSLYGKH